jgi:hypothetical protein
MSESERMPGIAKQIPRSADRIARFEDRVGFSGQAMLQMVGCADAGQASADDHDIEVLRLQGPYSRSVPGETVLSFQQTAIARSP